MAPNAGSPAWPHLLFRPSVELRAALFFTLRRVFLYSASPLICSKTLRVVPGTADITKPWIYGFFLTIRTCDRVYFISQAQ